MKKGVIEQGKRISRGREKLSGGTEVTPESLGISRDEFDAMAENGIIRVQQPRRKKAEEKEDK